MAYDALLLWGILFLAGLPLPLIAEEMRQLWWVVILTQVYLLAICLLFFGWFWVHGGQTLGMRAWRLKVVNPDGTTVTWRRAVIRFFSALLSWIPLGLGYLWVLVDKEKRAWHDHLSDTFVTLVPPSRGNV